MNKKKDESPADLPQGQSLRSQLRTWLKEICPGQKTEDYCQIMADSAAPEVMKVRIFTHDYRYTIIISERNGKGYIGFATTRRKSLAGLTEHTYTDLVDGNFSRVTWELIKTAMLRFELVKLAVKAREDQWQKMHSHYEQDGKQYYAEWEQKGAEIRNHKFGVLLPTDKKPILRDAIKKLK